MNKTMMSITLAVMISSSAMAEDYDNTAVKLTAETDAYNMSIKAPETGATEFSATAGVGVVDVTGTWSRDGDVDNYTLGVGKEVTVNTTPLYAGADAELTFGDSYNSDTRTVALTPYVGVSTTVDKLTPFAEVGYAWQSTTKDVLDLNANSSYVKVGASYAFDPKVSLDVSVKETRDTDFANPGDRQAEVGVVVKF